MVDDESSLSAENLGDNAGPEADQTIDRPASHESQPRSGAESAAAAAGSGDGGTTPPPAGRAGDLPPDDDATTPPPGGGSGPGSQRPAFSPRFPWPDRDGDQAAAADPLIGSELGGVRIVREDDPTPISSLNKTLRRDVAVIAAKCLQKDRTRRYSSATELGGDVERYLAGEPITAVPPTFWDGIVRLARRHKAAAAAVTAIAVSLVMAVAGISAFALRAEQAREEAELARGDAEQSRDEAELARNQAEQAQAAESEQRTAAEASALKANQQLYASLLYRFRLAISNTDQQTLAKNIWNDALKLYETIHGSDAGLPVELALQVPLLDGSLAVLGGHEKYVTSVAFSPDGTRLATGSGDNTARLWDAATGEQIAVLEGHQDDVTSVTFSPDGARLFTESEDSAPRLWDAATGEQITVLEGSVTSVAFNSDGTRLATGSWDNTARLWDPDTGEQIAVLEGHERGVVAVAFSPDGIRLATGSNDNTARLWDAATGELIAVLEGHEDEITSVAFSPDGTRLATGSGDNTARLWDAATGEQIAVLQGHQNQVLSIAFSPDGTRLATVPYLIGWDQDSTERVRLWDANTGEQIAVLEGQDQDVDSIAFSPDSTRLATAGDATARLWDAITGEELAVLEGSGGVETSVFFSPNSTRLVTLPSLIMGGGPACDARLWDARNGNQIAVLSGFESDANSVAFSPDGNRMATTSSGSTARIWDAATGEQLTVLKGHEDEVWSVVFSPDGNRLATASIDKTVRLWHVESSEQLSVLEGHRSSVDTVAFSPDGNRLATRSFLDENARLWDVATGELLAILNNGNDVRCLAFSPDGTRLATGLIDNTARLWDSATGELLAVFKFDESASDEALETCALVEADPNMLAPYGPWVTSVAFCPDGTRLVTRSSDNVLQLWDTVTGERISLMEENGYEHEATCIAFNPDSTLVATGSGDKTVRLWYATTGEQVAILEGHENSISDVTFSPDGTRLATGSWDKTYRLWDATNGKQLAVVEGQGERVFSVEYNADGSRLVTVSSGNTTRLWNAATGERIADLQGVLGPFSPDGKRLATWSGGNTIQIWDAATGEQLAVVVGQKKSFRVANFSPDGTRLATGSEDGIAQVWDASTGEQLAVLEGHEDGVNSLVFSPDGTRLTTGSDDDTARIWGLSNAEIFRNRKVAAEARSRLEPMVDTWLTAGAAEANARLSAAKATLSVDDWHHAANLLLTKASSRFQPTSALTSADAFTEALAAAVEQYQAAESLAAKGKLTEAIAQIDAALALPDLRDPQRITDFRTLRFRLAMQAGGPLALQAFTDAVAEASDDATKLDELAWGIEESAAAGREIPSELLEAATQIARTAVALTPTAGLAHDTLSHLLARGGRLEEAIEVQRLALEHATDESRDWIQGYLTELEILTRIRNPELPAIERGQVAAHAGEWCAVRIPAIEGRWLAEAGPCVLAAVGGGSSQTMTVVIPPRGLISLVAADVFDPALAYAGKTLRVAGQVQIENGQPQIEVLTAEQITVVADEPAETETAAKVSDNSMSPLDGAWRMVVPEDQLNIKLVAGGRFIWFVAENGKIIRSATGRCSLEGDRYTESIDAAGISDDSPIARNTGRFRARLIGNRWIHEGTPPSAPGEEPIQEVWERMSPGSAALSPSGPDAP